MDLAEKVQELKLQAFKTGYLSGVGKKRAAWKMRPVLQEIVEEIEQLATSAQGERHGQKTIQSRTARKESGKD